MIEVVRGRLEDAWAGEILAFWAARADLPEEEARRRLSDVVCVLRREGEIAGVGSAYPATVALLGGRRFWTYRSLLADFTAQDALGMMRATLQTLEGEFDGEPGSPIGLCLLLTADERRLLPPEAVWPDPRMTFAGYLEDDRQVRIAYFKDASIARV
ncbi:MAG TPA: hypothetical protein VIJ20_10465 [Solirubrobacteraceae bacterium]